MITIATLLWDANSKGAGFSSMYDESWVEKLWRGFDRNLTVPWSMVCYTDREREFAYPIEQVQIDSKQPSYADCIQPYELGVPMILVGLDTVVTGNCDHLALFAQNSTGVLGLPRDPYRKQQACNGVALVPAGMQRMRHQWAGENDMEWVRRFPHVFLDDLFPGHVVSYKGHVEKHGIGDARIVYFHGDRKPHQLFEGSAILRHWI